MPKKFLSIKEIAEIMDLPRQTINNWIGDGRLPAFRTRGFAEKGEPKHAGKGRGVVRVAIEDFEKFLKKYRTGEAQSPKSKV